MELFKKVAFLILCIFLVVAAGCNAQKPSETNPPAGSKTHNALIDEFQTLKQENASVEEVANFIIENITNASQENATILVDGFEQIQKEKITEFESLFFEDPIQNKINSEYKAITAGTDINDTELKELLAKTKNSGYKVETAEGTYFPVIDYSFYKQFSDNVTPDMKDYIDIMAVESDKAPAKDAALVIGWEDVLNRALAQEEFINTHKDSVKLDEVQELTKKYYTFTLYGLNNTPLFGYQTNTMAPEAKQVYEETAGKPGNSEFLKMLGEYMNLIKNSNYTLTDEVKDYRDGVIEGLQ